MKKLKHAIVTLATAASLGGLTASHAATDIDQIANLVTILGPVQGQNAFLALSEDLGGSIAYRSVSPAEALGITGFDLGVEVTNSKMNSSDEWIAAIVR